MVDLAIIQSIISILPVIDIWWPLFWRRLKPIAVNVVDGVSQQHVTKAWWQKTGGGLDTHCDWTTQWLHDTLKWFVSLYDKQLYENYLCEARDIYYVMVAFLETAQNIVAYVDKSGLRKISVSND